MRGVSEVGSVPIVEEPRWSKPFARALLAAFLVCGLAGIEAWPLTGWRLFSAVREERQESWRAVVVEGGRERPIPFHSFGPAYTGSVHVLGSFPTLPARERIAVCRAWLHALERYGQPAGEIRIYRISWLVSRREGDRAAAPDERTLRYACDETSVREVGDA